MGKEPRKETSGPARGGRKAQGRARWRLWEVVSAPPLVDSAAVACILGSSHRHLRGPSPHREALQPKKGTQARLCS